MADLETKNTTRINDDGEIPLQVFSEFLTDLKDGKVDQAWDLLLAKNQEYYTVIKKAALMAVFYLSAEIGVILFCEAIKDDLKADKMLVLAMTTLMFLFLFGLEFSESVGSLRELNQDVHFLLKTAQIENPSQPGIVMSWQIQRSHARTRQKNKERRMFNEKMAQQAALDEESARRLGLDQPAQEEVTLEELTVVQDDSVHRSGQASSSET